jgi:hypothetical protein
MEYTLARGVMLGVVFLAGTSADPPAKTDHPLFKEARSEDEIPKGLSDVFAKFVEAAKKDGEVESFLLPHAAVKFGTRDPKGNIELGDEIDKGFLKTHFRGEVFSVRKDPDDCYLIRTGTTALWFVETKSGVWKLYRYLDKPIE